jgi:hypothetical protein
VLSQGNVGAKDRAWLGGHVSPLALFSNGSVTLVVDANLRYE